MDQLFFVRSSIVLEFFIDGFRLVQSLHCMSQLSTRSSFTYDFLSFLMTIENSFLFLCRVDPAGMYCYPTQTWVFEYYGYLR